MQVEAVRKVSVASTSLCMWVHAIDVYARVARDVAPRRARLEEMNGAFEAANADLQRKQAELKRVLEAVELVQRK
jgi:dynein heavy chain, axonemal